MYRGEFNGLVSKLGLHAGIESGARVPVPCLPTLCSINAAAMRQKEVNFLHDIGQIEADIEGDESIGGNTTGNHMIERSRLPASMECGARPEEEEADAEHRVTQCMTSSPRSH